MSLQSKDNPTTFIEDLRAQLRDANALGVELKWILTGKMVVTNMANRSNILAQKLQGYMDGTTAVGRGDCADGIAHICALDEEGMTALESTGGNGNRAFNITSDSNGKDQESCKFGDDCYAKTASDRTVRITILLLPGREKRIGVPKTKAAKATRLVKVAIAAKAEKGALANSAANSKAARSTSNRTTAIHITGKSKSTIQPNSVAKKSELQRLT